jgi:sodium/hydrogen antiporter
MSASGFANFIVGGFLVILATWIPLFLSGAFVSLPMIAVAIGLLFGAADLVRSPMSAYSTTAETIAEFSLLVAVLGSGLRIDRRFSFRGWGSVWRLLFIVMPLKRLLGHPPQEELASRA